MTLGPAPLPWNRPTMWKRDRGCAIRASADGAASHTSLRPTLPYRFEKKLTGQRRSLEISGLLASRARNVADTF
jgi:hypothetical protein